MKEKIKNYKWVKTQTQLDKLEKNVGLEAAKPTIEKKKSDLMDELIKDYQPILEKLSW